MSARTMFLILCVLVAAASLIYDNIKKRTITDEDIKKKMQHYKIKRGAK
jgi:cell division protein FtsL